MKTKMKSDLDGLKVMVETEVKGSDGGTERLTRYFLTTAFEGGVGYWCPDIVKYTAPAGTKLADWKEGGRYAPEEYEPLYGILPTIEGGSVTIKDCEGKKHEIGLTEVKRGWTLLAKLYPVRFLSALEDFDAEDADVWLQLCVFGEVIYG